MNRIERMVERMSSRRDPVVFIASEDDLVSVLQEMGVKGLSKVAGEADIKWQAVFLVGASGAGKSTFSGRTYLKHTNFKVVDPDEVKQRNPLYDPERPYQLHEWSKEVSDGEFDNIVTSGNGDPVVVDGTGRDTRGVGRKMDLAQRMGYRIFLVYVWVPLEVSLFRNRNRERFVPEKKVMEAYYEIENSFYRLRGMADKSKVVVNYSSGDLTEAKDDMATYPPPQAIRPPRPGDADYGLARAACSNCRTRDEDMPQNLDIGFQQIPQGDEWSEARRTADMKTVKHWMYKRLPSTIYHGSRKDWHQYERDGVKIVFSYDHGDDTETNILVEGNAWGKLLLSHPLFNGVDFGDGDTKPEGLEKVADWVFEKEMKHRTANIKVARTFSDFERALKNHDWMYEMADDHSVWANGKAEADIIENMARELVKIDPRRVEELYNKYGKEGVGRMPWRHVSAQRWMEGGRIANELVKIAKELMGWGNNGFYGNTPYWFNLKDFGTRDRPMKRQECAKCHKEMKVGDRALRYPHRLKAIFCQSCGEEMEKEEANKPFP